MPTTHALLLLSAMARIAQTSRQPTIFRVHLKLKLNARAK
jgi:hypothetical protein